MDEYYQEEDPGVIPEYTPPPEPEPAEEEETPYYSRPTAGTGYELPAARPAGDELALDESGRPPARLDPALFRPASAPVTAPETPSEIQLDAEGRPPRTLTPDQFFAGAGTASRPGAFARGAAEGVIPGIAGMGAGILSGAGTGALLGAAGANPFTVGAGAIGGGVLGGILAGYAGSRAQEWAMEQLGLREGEGTFSRKQAETDRALFPYSRTAGEMLPTALTLRPGGRLIERGISGVIGGGAEAVQDYTQTGKVDPYKVAMGVGVGAALPNINRPFSQAVGRAAPRSWQPYMPNYDPASRIRDVDENYLPRAPREEGPRQPYGPQRPPPAMPGTGGELPGTSPYAPSGRPPGRPPPPPPPPNDPGMPGVGTNLPGTGGAPTPRAPVTPPDELYNAPAGPLPGTISPERATAMRTLDRQIETARINREQHPPDDMIGLHSQWSRHYDNLVARRAAMIHGSADVGTEASQGLGGPTPTRQRMDQFNDATTTASGHAMVNRPPPQDAGIGMGPAAAGNKPVRSVVDESKVALRTTPGEPTVPSTPVIQGHAAPDTMVALKAAQPEAAAKPPVGAAPPAAPPPAATAATPQSAAAARPAAPTPPRVAPPPVAQKSPVEPRPAAPPAAEPTGIPPQVFADRILRASGGDPAAAVKFLDDAIRRDPSLAQNMPAAEARTLLAQRAATAPVTPTAPVGRTRAIAASRAAEAQRAPPAVPVAKRPTLTLPGKKETVGEKLKRGAKGLAKSEEGSIDIGPATRQSTEIGKERGVGMLSGRYAPQALRPNEIAKAMLGAAEGDARYALTLMNRKMTENKGWALRRDVVEARNILAKQAEGIARRPEPSPEVPVVPGKTRADLQPRKTELIPAKREYTPPGKRTPQKVIDPVTGEVRETRVFREERKPPPQHGLANYTPEERLKFGEAIKGLTEGKQLEAMALTKAVPKQTVLDNIDDIPKLLERERAARTVASRETATGKGAENLQYKAHREGILAAYDRAVADNPRPTGRDETLKETIERATKIVKATKDEVNKTIAQLTLDRPKYAGVFTGSLDTKRLKNPPPATKIVNAARDLLAKPTPKSKLAFDSEEVLALSPEPKGMKGGLTEGGEAATPEAEVLAGPRYEARADPDSPTFTSGHKELTDMLNGMSNKAHDMMQDAWGESIATELARTKDPNKLKADLLGALVDAQDKQNKYAHALPDYPETLVASKPVSTRAEVEQTGRFKPTKPADYQNLTEAERKAAPVRGPEALTVDTYRQIKDAITEFFGKKALPGKLAKGEIGGTSPEKTEKWLAQAGRILGDIPHDYRGSLDVTKVFDWIDKVAKKFRPDREPMVPTGMTRLYKGPEGKWTELPPEQIRSDFSTSDRAAATRAHAAQLREEGLTNAEIGARLGVTPNRVSALIGDYKYRDIKAGFTPTRKLHNITHYVDVPTSVIDQVRVDGLPGPGVGEKAAKRFADKWAREIAVNPDVPDKRVSFEPKDMPLVDHLRKLWADEDGALSVGKLPNWVTGAAARLRSHYVPDASPAVMDYMKKIGKDAVVMGTNIARKVQDTIYAAKAAPVRTQAESGQIYRAWENNKISSLSPELQKHYKDHIEPVIKKAEATYDELREIMTRNKFFGHDKMPERVDNGPEYAKFIFRRQNIPFDENTGFDAITNRSRLSLWTQSVEPRNWFALQQDGTKAREIFHVNDEGHAVLWKDGVGGKRIKVPDGVDPAQVGSRIDDKLVDHARIDEIMRHARDYDEAGKQTKKFVYHDNPMFTASDAYIGLSQSLERAKFLDRLVNDITFQNYMSARTESAAEKKWGKGNFEISEMPHFKNQAKPIYFPKQVAWALNDAVKTGFHYSGNSFMDKLARFNQATLKPFYFLGPEVHVFNVLDKLIVGRGFDNLNIQKSWRNMSEALRDVRNQGDMQTLIMQSGGNPMFAHSMTQRAYPNLGHILGVEVAQRPWKWDPLRRLFGKDIKPGWERVYQKSNDMMWWQSDVLYQMMYRDNLDRHGGGHKVWQKKFAELDKLTELKSLTPEQTKQRNELTAWKQELGRKAVVETEKVIDSYVVPTTFGKTLGLEGTEAGRFMQQVLTEPAFTNFGRFSYGLFKALANVAKNMAGQNENLTAAQSAALGFSQAAMLLFTANVMYPALSKAYQQTPWAKPESEVERRGVTSLAMLIPELIHKGVKDGWSRIAQRAYAPSTVVSGAMEIFQNRDFAGRPIVESGSGWGEVPGQVAEYAVSKLMSPATGISRAASQEGPEYSAQRFLESQFGLKTPTDKAIKYEAQREQKLRQEGRTRERHPRGVIEAAGSAIHRAVRGYAGGGLVTATATGVIPTSRR